ncbi:hypothetical protein L207DRAFT_575564 [Hyaloscypha variabilis F]|uniref:Uncharacterized protein n=1 Tax=Hyaloscypha variabilis (strain UAMH 11265 / GT02V1 / F) TaxID=1149755 RepID=A0A2J6SDT5_HYAVF|nr:hypothetical protein L207DRAFT_575564 [Hyaloscypha variabilis F]
MASTLDRALLKIRNKVSLICGTVFMGLVEQVALPFDEYFDHTEDDILMLIGLGFRAYWAIEDVVKNCANRIDEVVG